MENLNVGAGLKTPNICDRPSGVKSQKQSSVSEQLLKGQVAIQGKWLEEENVKFVIYITLYRNVFKSKEKRKAERIFKIVADFLQTRTPRQCRSHFQKMIKKFKTIFQMKKHYRDLIGHQKFDNLLNDQRQVVCPDEDELKSPKTSDVKQISVQTDFPEFSHDFHLNFQPFPSDMQYVFYYCPTNSWPVCQ